MKTKTKSDTFALHCDPMDESSRLTNNDYFASVFTHEPHGYVPSMDSRTNKVTLYEAIYHSISNHICERILLITEPEPESN